MFHLKHELAQLEAEVRSQLRQFSSDELTSKQRFRAGLDADQDHALRNRRLPNPANALLEFRGGLSSSALLWAREFTLEFLVKFGMQFAARTQESAVA